MLLITIRSSCAWAVPASDTPLPVLFVIVPPLPAVPAPVTHIRPADPVLSSEMPGALPPLEDTFSNTRPVVWMVVSVTTSAEPVPEI